MGLATAVARLLRGELASRERVTGVVTGTAGTQVVVTVDGQTMTLPRLASYTPVTNGDSVFIDCNGPMLIIGKAA